jgi:hypothetical protein
MTTTNIASTSRHVDISEERVKQLRQKYPALDTDTMKNILQQVCVFILFVDLINKCVQCGDNVEMADTLIINSLKNRAKNPLFNKDVLNLPTTATTTNNNHLGVRDTRRTTQDSGIPQTPSPMTGSSASSTACVAQR